VVSGWVLQYDAQSTTKASRRLISLFEVAIELFPAFFGIDMLVRLLRCREVVVPEDVLSVSSVDSVEEITQATPATVEFEGLTIDIEIRWR
jgi:hypothetical protein